MNRYLKYELLRATTIKSTIIFPLIGIAGAWLFAYFGLHDINSAWLSNGLPVPSLVEAINNSYSPLSIFFITIPFAQAFGHDYRDGTMRLTLSAFPIRSRVLVAKFFIPSLIATIAAGIALLGIWAMYQAFLPVPNNVGGLQAIGRHTAFTIFWGLLVASVVIFTRIMAAGIAGLVVWAAILENVVVAILGNKFPKLQSFLPLSEGMMWAARGNTRELIVISVATVLTVALAAIKFIKKDA